ncbi:putative pab-dependent polyspecific ribonuclease subunit pan2 [Phaeomoniella chlamydospora]|uniref:Putative pab-dependent polyspecific ribonuclease subunit pan2 n=1 Tax=Phaeomoniella chlamydospora TaxID=158046 RepID=A0A0G2EQ42_PHACM|nr:putative pab-dependent polyspecific ribonuclease subunit pan2 [Phaeomoniella chlamydospora]
MYELRCMTFTSRASQILVAGCQKSMFVIDIEKGAIIQEVPAESNYTMMKRSRYICAATDDGAVNILGADFKVIKSWKAHGTVINDMDARSDYLVTCGFSVRQMGTAVADPLANIYDLKNLRSLPPIPFHAGASFVRLHPKLQTTSFIASQSGQIQVVDLMNPNTVNLRQANVNFMIGMDLSNTGDALAISDADCSVHLWGSPSKIHFSKRSKETEFADDPTVRAPFLGWNDEPLGTVGMPYYNEKLLSAWPSHFVFDVGAPPPQIDPAMIPYLQKVDGAQYAPNPRKTRRYQVWDTRAVQAETSMTAPKFLSEKAKNNGKHTNGRRASDAAQSLAATSLDDKTGDEVLLKYSNVEIKYSRFGVDDFDFRYYNKTEFSGLETHISNSYTNALLQLYRFMPLIRNLALHHAATSCFADPCHLCELGFLFDMLEKAAGQNCQATNLLKTLSSSPEASKLGILEEGNVQSLTGRIEAANKFFLHRIASDHQSLVGNTDEVSSCLGTSGWTSQRCLHCGDETVVRSDPTYLTELTYPNIDPKHASRNAALRFSSVLKASLENIAPGRGYCPNAKCKSYQQMSRRRTMSQMPYTLMINAVLTNPKYRQLWETPGWLPTEIGVLIQGRSLYVFEGNDLALHQRNNTAGLLVYELVGFVAEIDIAEHHRPHLVSFINVDVSSSGAAAESNPTKQSANWHLFNDFLVTPLPAREALLFNSNWKTPSVLGYQIKSAHGAIDNSWKESLDLSILFHPYSVNKLPPQRDVIVLEPAEKPISGAPIALDTEFVDLEKAEIDVKADGTQETIRPSKSGLARVSVLRGAGEQEGKPFIDDYITIRDPIVDYKTQYSGIRPGDLDIRTSTHNLVPLKVAYKKLWLLLNLGCVFVGHGLASDFRKINIQVPKSQTVDTQYLYLQPGKNRRLSLRYLAWAVFREYIQEDPVITTTTTVVSGDPNDPSNSGAVTTASTTATVDPSQIEGHDSITDALMALRLWRKYLEWSDAGVLEQMVEEIYREGYKYGYRPPIRNSLLANATITTAPATPGRVGGNSAVPSGRNTPDVTMGSGGVSTPGTPPTTSRGTNNIRISGTPKGSGGTNFRGWPSTPK